jgi:hypothetical protein
MGGVGYIASAAKEAAASALDTAKAALDIHSPSRVFKNEVGMMIGAGMAEGIKDSTFMVNSAMNNLNSKLVPSTSYTAKDKAYNYGSNVAQPTTEKNVVVNVDKMIMQDKGSKDMNLAQLQFLSAL